MAEQRDIKYINREFSDFKGKLVEFAKNYFPDSYNDFSPASPGMMFIEMAAYVGDVLSFYQDTQLQETFLQHAKNPSNLYSLAYMMGYRPKVTSAAEVKLTVTQTVAAKAPYYEPNFDQALKVSANSTVQATVGDNPTFIIKDNVDFKFSSSYDPTEIQILSVEDGDPAEYLLTKYIDAYSGNIKTISKTFDSVERFKTIEIDEQNIIGVLDIVDSEGNTWYEVPFLGQDTIFEETTNTATDSNLVPASVTLKKVPRRFVTRFTSKGVMQIQFGAGVRDEEDSSFLPNPTNTGMNSRDYLNRLDFSYDPSNFLFTRSYGLAPNNTTLTIRYLVGGGVEANVPANTITTIGNVTTTAIDDTYASTVAFTNAAPAEGGRDGDSVEEIRQNSLRAFSEQKRAVTAQDYTVRAMSLPPRFGTVAKVYTTQDYVENSSNSVLDRNPLSISLYTLAMNNEGKLTTSSISLKNNLRNYLSEYMLITDSISIKDAFIVNIGVKYEIVSLPNYSARDVLLACNLKLQEHFKIDKWSINQPINLSNIFTLLDRVKGVQTVKNIFITNKAGGRYSEYAYDTQGAVKDNILYPSFDPCIFEVKYPEVDIEGRITTL